LGTCPGADEVEPCACKLKEEEKESGAGSQHHGGFRSAWLSRLAVWLVGIQQVGGAVQNYDVPRGNRVLQGKPYR
jgi:hypothetical protein